MRSTRFGLVGFSAASVGLHALALTSAYLLVAPSMEKAVVSEVANTISIGLRASQAGQTRVTQPVEPKPAPLTAPPEPVVEPVTRKPVVKPVAKPAPEAMPVIEEQPVPDMPAQQVEPVERPEMRPAEPAPIPQPSEQIGDAGKSGSAENTVKTVETGDADEAGAQALEAGYDLTVMRALKAEKRYPAMAKRRKQEGSVRLSFTIDPAGHIVRASDIQVDAEWPALEQAVHDQLQRAAPFDPAPDGVRWSERRYTVSVNFDLKRDG